MTTPRGRVCVVTGASSGIGRALAVALASNGDSVWAVARRMDELRSLSAEVPGVVPIQADLALDTGVESAAREILENEDGAIDVLVHAAGAIELGSLETQTADAFDRLYAVNLRAPFVLTRLLLPGLKRARGHVVFVSSSAALRASHSNALYSATKHGLKALADGLREGLGGDGVRVTSIYLGRVATPMQESVHAFEDKPYRPEVLLQPSEVVRATLGVLAMAPGSEVTDVHVRSAWRTAGA